MNSTDQKFDSVLASLGLPGPRVTLAMVEEVLVTVTYDTRVIPGTTCTQATAILPTGFVVGRGDAACADPANFNPALGIERAISRARDNARDEIWKLEGYRLSQALHEARQGTASAALQQIRTVLRAGRVSMPITVTEWAADALPLGVAPGSIEVGGVEVVASAGVPPGAAYLSAGEREFVKIRTDSPGAGATE